MTEIITRDEFALLAARLDVLEREVDGEKMVTRHVLSETRRTGDRLLGLEARLDRMDGKVDDLGKKLDDAVRRLAAVDGKVAALTAALPRIVADALRMALRERDGR
jgi:CII-binding regulator of phage lambda lysogenization HflD